MRYFSLNQICLAVPLPIRIIQEGEGGFGHGTDRLTQQPVFVLKHKEIYRFINNIKTVIYIYQQIFDHLEHTFPGLSKLPPRGALTSLNSFWYCGAAVQGE